MLVREAKLKDGSPEQYAALDEAIRTGQFVQNKALRFWMDNPGKGKFDLNKYCAVLAKEFEFANKLNSSARQASAERAWAAISSFYRRCKEGAGKKGLEIVGIEWNNNSTSGQEETGEQSRTTGETRASAEEEQSESVSSVAEPVTRIPGL